MQQLYKKYSQTIICIGILMLLSIFGCIMVVIRSVYTGYISYYYLIWNLFLSWIPLGIAFLMSYVYSNTRKKKNTVFFFILGMFWLLFYPNAPYMITDFVHFRHSGNFLTWFDLVIYSTFIFTSFLIGFISIYLVSRIVEKRTNKLIGWLFTLFILFISSYGIYLGRFIRWNSWDLLTNPLKLFRGFFVNINFQSIVFSIIYGLLLTLIYAFLYGLTYLKLEKID